MIKKQTDFYILYEKFLEVSQNKIDQLFLRPEYQTILLNKYGKREIKRISRLLKNDLIPGIIEEKCEFVNFVAVEVLNIINFLKQHAGYRKSDIPILLNLISEIGVTLQNSSLGISNILVISKLPDGVDENDVCLLLLYSINGKSITKQYYTSDIDNIIDRADCTQ